MSKLNLIASALCEVKSSYYETNPYNDTATKKFCELTGLEYSEELRIIIRKYRHRGGRDLKKTIKEIQELYELNTSDFVLYFSDMTNRNLNTLEVSLYQQLVKQISTQTDKDYVLEAMPVANPSTFAMAYALYLSQNQVKTNIVNLQTTDEVCDIWLKHENDFVRFHRWDREHHIRMFAPVMLIHITDIYKEPYIIREKYESIYSTLTILTR